MNTSLYFHRDHKNHHEHQSSPPVVLQVPNVFIVPPEEDHSPIWCCFDAAQPSQSFSRLVEEEIEFLDSDSVHGNVNPRQAGETRSIVDALMSDEFADNYNDTDSEFDGEMDQDLYSDHQSEMTGRTQYSRLPRDAAEDSDVIEVVKVGRSRSRTKAEDQTPAPIKTKPSSTFRARASKAFRSLTGSLRASKPRVHNVSSSVPSNSQMQPDEEQGSSSYPRPRTPTMSRRSSIILSQLFSAPSLKSRSSTSSFDHPANNIAPSSPSAPSFPSCTHLPTSRRASIYQEENQDLQSRAPSPCLSTASHRTTNRRFSMLNLQKLFSFPSTPRAATPSSDDTEYIPSSSRVPSATSSESTTSGPQTPTSTEEAFPTRLASLEKKQSVAFDLQTGSQSDVAVGSNLRLAMDAVDSDTFRAVGFDGESDPATTPTQTHYKVDDSGLGMDQGDTSLEMRLDSLHFDSLSFDADHFNISLSR